MDNGIGLIGAKWQAWIIALSEVIAWYENMVYTGHTMTKKKDYWLLIVRGYKKKDAPKCVFYHAATPLDAWRLFAYDIGHWPGVPWKNDKYAPTS